MGESKKSTSAPKSAPPRFRVAVMLSGRGSNFEALLNTCHQEQSCKEEWPIDFAVVMADNSTARGLQIAVAAGVPTRVVPREPKELTNAQYNAVLAAEMAPFQPDLIVLAGFMRILTTEFISRFRGKIINIHPSLLPSFKGLNAQQQALKAGVKFSGCTVHVALEELDSGPIIAQAVVPVMPDDTEESLSERILKEEHRLLPAVVNSIARGSIRVVVHSDQTVSVEDGGR